MITIKDVARRCDVSASTVSRALADSPLLPASTKEKIKRVAEELGYVKNEMATSLKTGVSKTFGVVNFVDEKLLFSHYLFAKVLSGFSSRANELSYDICLISPQTLYTRDKILSYLRAKNLSGVLVLSGHLQSEGMKALLEIDIPSVVFDPREEKILGLSDCISSDNFGGMYSLTASIIKKGHNNIAYVSGEDYFVTHERLKGFKKAIEDNGLSFDPEMIYGGNYYNLSSVGSVIEKVLAKSPRPTCIIMSDDYCAVQAYEILRRKNIRIGEDISIAGFDGIELATHLQPRLTTVVQNSFEMGKHAADMLVRACKSRDKEFYVTPTYLVETESVKDIGESSFVSLRAANGR